ncbi:MAG: ATP-binding protein, partial [Bacteroidales bacterium]|nr:ATP-binding protein [Bacteroidales bacterium]
MRQLSKIIFINSANIRYGEVLLDGNVHLIGTQGVGKSTVLRAILFFYTAEKNKLGISREKKTFDDFYLPGANSYLIYEVESEFGAFTVLVFRRNAHSVFRFINAPFQKEWIIDENGEVTADSSVIRRRLGSASMTRIVDEYQEYRDIIYGNRRVAGKEFARYCIMETAKYQNIPRSLQNVFLGAKVDADFIKDIIIRSLGDEEPGIDLVYFRSQLAGFEREYNDIQIWFQKNKQGEVTVRRQGEKVIEHYRHLLYLDDELVRALLELRFARRYAQEHIPLMEKQAEDKEIELNRHKEKLSELQDKFNHELSSLEQEYGALKDKLDRIPELRKKYEQLKIQELIEEYGREPALKAQLESACALKDRLTREYADISAKYATVEREQRLGFDAWKAAMEGRKVEIGAAYNNQMQKVADTLRAELGAIEEAFLEKEEAVRGQLEDLTERIGESDKQLTLAGMLAPYASEIAAARAELSKFNGEDRALKASEKEMQARIDAATKEALMQQSEREREYDDKHESIRIRIAELSSQITEIEEMLASMDGSLIQWLSQHKPDWAQNIGKVADERTVLYAKNLWPTEGKGNSLYGVDIDLNGLKTRARMPEQLMEEKHKLEKERQKQQAEQEMLLAEKESELSALRKKHNARIKDIKEQQAQLQTAALMLPAKIEGVQKQIAAYEQRTQEERVAAKSRYKQQLDELQAQKVLAAEQRTRIQGEKLAEKKRIEEADAKRRKSLKQQYDAAVSGVAKEIAAKETALQQSLEALAKERSLELAGQGADTKALEKCEAEIRELTARLERIGTNKEVLFNYRKDKAEFLDKRDVFLSQKKSIEGKKDSLSERYKLRRKKEEDSVVRLNDALSETKDQLKTLREGLQEADNFEQSNALPMLPDGREQKTDKTCRQLIDLIHRVLSEKRKTEQGFSQSVNSFTGNFSPGNIFGFKTDNHTDEDYRSFAAA